jgi:hypothetical protein
MPERTLAPRVDAYDEDSFRYVLNEYRRIGEKKMKARLTTACVIAATLIMPYCVPAAFAQAGTMGTRQMRDVQRKAEQKARNNQSQQNPAQPQSQPQAQKQTQQQTQQHEASAAKPVSSP